MATLGRLSRPPIQEALVDFRTGGSTLDPEALSPLWPQVRDRYPKLEVRNRLEARVETRSGQPPNAQAEDLGFFGLFLQAEDGSRVAQFRANGVTVSQLTGYTTADDLFTEALELWQRYADLVHPEGIVRVALRYINRLALPFRKGDDFERFLTAPVTMPPDAPQHVSEFLVRTVIQLEPGISTAAIVTQRLEPDKNGTGSNQFVLDIDVFRRDEFRMTADDLLPLLQELREIKNRLFFSFVTDEALEPYK